MTNATSLTSVLQQLLENATDPKVVTQLMTPDATYVSLNFDDPDLKRIMPWAGTHEGPLSLVEAYTGVQTCWKTLDLKVTDTIEQENRVAFFGSFTYRSNTTGRQVTSPFSLLARFENGKVKYAQFLEDSFGTASSFRTGGATRFHSDPSGSEVEV
jgi:ketosteroid isomerase-like protein